MPTKAMDEEYWKIVDFFIEHPMGTFDAKTITEYVGDEMMADLGLRQLRDNGIYEKDGKFGLHRNPIITRLLIRLSREIAKNVKGD